MFTTTNTLGYTESELAALNAEWEAIVESEGLGSDYDTWIARSKEFSDEVSRRYDD